MVVSWKWRFSTSTHLIAILISSLALIALTMVESASAEHLTVTPQPNTRYGHPGTELVIIDNAGDLDQWKFVLWGGPANLDKAVIGDVKVG